jgi:hypothetical protein
MSEFTEQVLLYHFSHLIGKALLEESILQDLEEVTQAAYKTGISAAVSDSFEELRMSYEAATQRGEDYFKHLIWALAHSDVVDVRIDDWIRIYQELCSYYGWTTATDTKLRNAIGNFGKENYGNIVRNTPARYGSADIRYRYKRFCLALMRGHVRLQAEQEGVKLGNKAGL